MSFVVGSLNLMPVELIMMRSPTFKLRSSTIVGYVGLNLNILYIGSSFFSKMTPFEFVVCLTSLVNSHKQYWLYGNTMSFILNYTDNHVF